MHFDAVQTVAYDPFHLILQPGHFRMERTEAGEIAVQPGLFQNKSVDGADSARCVGHRQHHKVVNAGLIAPLQKHVHSAVHFHAAFQLVEIPDAFSGLPGDLGGVNMGVNINNMHKIASIYGIFLVYHKNRKMQPLFCGGLGGRKKKRQLSCESCLLWRPRTDSNRRPPA